MVPVRSDFPPMLTDEAPPSPDDEFLDNYKTSTVSRATAQIPPAAAMSIRTSKRIQSQKGVFTIHHARWDSYRQLGGWVTSMEIHYSEPQQEFDSEGAPHRRDHTSHPFPRPR